MLNPILLKVAPLLAEFLYSNKRLDLPGIGSFTLSSSAEPDQASFETNPGIRDSPELVDFIASSTGKIRALAAADLDSHLELARQFLNIGKPFLFDGIGSLTKQQTGNFSFVPGVPVMEKANPKAAKDSPDKENEATASEGFKSIFYAPRVKTNHRKTLFIFLLIAGVGLAIWGGYTVYKRTTSKNTDIVVEKEETPQQAVQTTEQTNTVRTTDPGIVTNDTTVKATPPVAITPPGNYKFVVETANKTRGLARYHRLKSFGLDVRMETRDSVSFRIFFLLPLQATDTTRYLDSLKRLYTPPGGFAYIEK